MAESAEGEGRRRWVIEGRWMETEQTGEGKRRDTVADRKRQRQRGREIFKIEGRRVS